MHTQPITLQLDENAASIYQRISNTERDKISHLFSLLINHRQQLPDFLSLLMDTISLRARQRGLTEEKLEELLRDD
uniref:Uncharacterized protein n=1 Tax=Candidatus Kentrum sp. FM TaxID=2126340 RepID=A0A450S6X1_9GAMM|nr:MAG: hypothetical protein BECKFM1743A_GA0114220_100499 [Candidatus Kentron sp. FM]VFJ52378.1 MAG: hypothetical protein BECKFM1743C_GA0114222_101086 [Candidatus Kentron sp. FM]VFK07715.1 MAG: hypothetical protein BECKFM1743B_GA0114221_100499 [Candidatus Kentron sp. FM]